MTIVPQASNGNILLGSLAPADYALLEPHFTRGPLDIGNVVAEAECEIETICFPEGGVVSFSEVLANGGRIGIGIVGCEGVAGWPVLLGCPISTYEATVAVAGGSALHIRNEALLEACARSPSLARHLLCFVQTFTLQLGRTIVSNLIDPVERRLARWLLMNHDRLSGDDIELTHQQIGVMLGVRRASVTDALHLLEGDGLIRARRGCVTIRDRERLRQTAGEGYGFAEAQYSRLIAPFGKDA
jgi:CRP-like cAMP-binding protein